MKHMYIEILFKLQPTHQGVEDEIEQAMDEC